LNTAGKKTVKREIFISSLISSIILLIAFGLFFSKNLYQAEMSKAKSVIRHRNNTINLFIDGYFSEIKNTVKVLAADGDIQNAPSLDAVVHQRILNTYKSFAKSNKNITYIYSGYTDGLLLINNYTPPEEYNPIDRPWYKSAVAEKPNVSVGTPYQEIKDKEWLISTGIALPGKNGRAQGVVAIDSSIQMIANLLKQRGLEYKTSYSYVLNQNQELIIHHDEAYLNKFLPDAIKTSVNIDQNKGEFDYMLGNIKKNAYYSRIPETGWIVITVVEKMEIIRPIIKQIFLTIIFPVLIALLFALTQSIFLSQRFSRPLIELQKRVNTIISGKSNENFDYQYPNNEIGIIAKEVGQLTEHELFMKAEELKETNIALNQTIEELQTLQGIIPICSSCKKIRDDAGSWNQLESYIEKHSGASFSHGMCPECLDEFYGKENWYIEMKKKKSDEE